MRFDQVVVGYDGSSDAERAVSAAIELVTPEGKVHVVTAFHPERSAEIMRHLDQVPEEFRFVIDPEADEVLRQEPAIRRLRDAGVECVGHIVPDHPSTAIIDVAESEGVDLVIVGSRGLGGMRRFLRGSVSARVATHAPMSVFIVHDPDAAA